MLAVMIALYYSLLHDHAFVYVAIAFTICCTAGLILAVLLRRAEFAGADRWRWLVGSALIAGLGVWTTHFLAMLGYRTDLFLDYDPTWTAISAGAAVMAVGIPLAVSAVVRSWPSRLLCGAMAGAGISVMHGLGMYAVRECAQPLPHEAGAACLIGAAAFAAARTIPRIRRSMLTTAALIAIGVCGTHFVAISGIDMAGLAIGGLRPRDTAILSILTSGGAAVLLFGAILAILVARRFEAQEQSHANVLSTAMENMSNGLVLIDRDGSIGLFNQRFLDMFGLEIDALSLGMTLDTFLDRVGDANGWHPEKRATVGARILARANGNEAQRTECVMNDGRVFIIWSRPLAEGGAVLTFDDVTSDRQAQSQIAHMAFHDPLTGLPNRRALQDRMEQGFRPKQRFKLLLIDLDRFKVINDTYGHSTGDRLLVETAKRIRSTLTADHFAARIGGDEMAVLVYGDLERSLAVASDLIGVMEREFLVDGHRLSIGCSVGLCCTDDAENAQDLMKRADLALYEAKRVGRGRAFCYRPGMLEEAAARHHLETDMRTALEQRQFHLVYQPIVSTLDGDVLGYEALIRWRHPVLGAISPAHFIPIAEESGQIIQIGRWVLAEACREASTWSVPRSVAVNLSCVQLRSPGLVADVTEALESSGLDPRRLEVELTETALAQDPATIASSLAALQQLGIQVAMDDFGTGYSSLTHLRNFPFDRIKIDRSFVMSAESDAHSLAVLRAMTQIGRELSISILAEGVETASQLTLLRTIGCDAVQGYHLGRPDRAVDRPRLSAPAAPLQLAAAS